MLQARIQGFPFDLYSSNWFNMLWNFCSFHNSTLNERVSMSDTMPEILILIAPIFAIGQLVATPNALSQLTNEDISSGLNRHCSGDWGDLDKHDLDANNRALVEGTRMFSAYDSKQGIRFWIITEWDRSVTTILLPQDY